MPMSKWHFFIVLIYYVCLSSYSNGQLTGGSDRTQQELNLLTWTSGIRLAYCQEMQIGELILPFKEAIARMINRYCRNATACNLMRT